LTIGHLEAERFNGLGAVVTHRATNRQIFSFYYGYHLERTKQKSLNLKNSQPAFMKKPCLFLFPLSILLLFTACQKELSIEVNGSPSSGSLQSDGADDCLPKTVQGVYEAGEVLKTDSNYIDVQVNVTTAGSYRVYSDTVNGVYFESKGSFATAGLNTIRLAGSGTPLAAGNHIFTLAYDSTECTVIVSTLSQGGATDALFTLDGAPDICMDYAVAGAYIEGVAATPANTVVIKVDVTDPGTYSLTSNLSNGLSFSGTGAFIDPGPQTITLTATGTPIVAASTSFTLTVDATTCSFAVDITTTNPVNYFPTTTASNWSYQFDDDPNDSLLVRAKTGTVTLAGNVYTVFEGTADASGVFVDIGNYRKAGSDYHTYTDLGFYFGLDAAQNVDYIFLKDNIAAGTGWQTNAVTGSIGGTPISIRIAFTIEQQNATITVGPVSYPNTIVVIEKYEVYDGTNWVDATTLIGYYKSYYARDIGLVKQDYYYEDANADPPVASKQDIRRHQVF
jgi:hypothetical protein